MLMKRGPSCRERARVSQGCGRSWGWILPTKFVLMTALVLATVGLSTPVAKGELMLYISDGTNSLAIDDNGLHDLESTTDTMLVDIVLLESYFSGWDFGAFFNVVSSLQDIGGIPTQVLNLEFTATNTSGSVKNLEVLASYTGSNGGANPSTINFFGGARTNQGDVGYTFVGAYSRNDADTFYTNGYVDKDGPTQFVLTASPGWGDDPFDPSPEDLVLDLGGVPAKDIVGNSTYALTYGVRITNLAPNKYFGTASELDYLLPEPASVVTWSVIGLGLLRLRRRNSRKI